MPELPEVETIVRRLQAVLPGKKIMSAQVLHPKSWQATQTTECIGAQILGVSRKAKVIRIDLTNSKSLLIHLKMTGQLIYLDQHTRLGGGHPTADWTAELPSKHTRIIFDLSDLAKLFFNDQRIFGWVKLLSSIDADAELRSLAPDVHLGEVDAKKFHAQLQCTSRAVKLAVLDGKIVSGVGNIYACDALHLAKINPQKPANTLSFRESERLLDACVHVIKTGIEMGGASIEHFRHVDGFSGKYQDVRRVYAREGDACDVCDCLIEKFSLAGRGTYWCPKCQGSSSSRKA